MTADEARELLINLLPPGKDELYDLTPGSDVWEFFAALGDGFKEFAFDLLDTLRREVPGGQLLQKIPDWVHALGIGSQVAVAFGTVEQQRAAIVAKLREFGAFCDPVMQSIFGPLLGYFDTTPVELIRADRGQLRLLHSYGQAVDVVVPASGSATVEIFVEDGGKVPWMGAQLDLAFSAVGVQVQLDSPYASATASWTPTVTPCRLASRAFTGAQCRGTWKLTLTNPTGAPITLYSAPWLFVEGMATGLDTAGAAAHWGVYADPLLIGENGNAPDFGAVQRAIARAKHSHGVGALFLTKAPEFDSAFYDLCTWS